MIFSEIYRADHSKAAEYTFFSSTHRTFLKIEYILGHKSSLSKFKEIEIISSTFSDHNTEISYEENSYKKNKHIEAKQYAGNQSKDH